MANRGNFSHDEKLTCFSYFVMGMTLEQIAEQRPPSVQTLERWSKDYEWDARKAAIDARVERILEGDLEGKKQDFVQTAWEKIALMVGALDKEKSEKAHVHHLTTAIGTLIDKAALLSGDPTGRTEHVDKRWEDIPHERRAAALRILAGSDSSTANNGAANGR